MAQSTSSRTSRPRVEPPEALTITQVAERLQVSYRKVQYLIADGDLKAIKGLGRATRVSRAEVERFKADDTRARRQRAAERRKAEQARARKAEQARARRRAG